MKRTFSVASRRACLRVLLIACPFDFPSPVVVYRFPPPPPSPPPVHTPSSRAHLPLSPPLLTPRRLAVTRDSAFFDKLDHAIVRAPDGSAVDPGYLLVLDYSPWSLGVRGRQQNGRGYANFEHPRLSRLIRLWEMTMDRLRCHV